MTNRVQQDEDSTVIICGTCKYTFNETSHLVTSCDVNTSQDAFVECINCSRKMCIARYHISRYTKICEICRNKIGEQDISLLHTFAHTMQNLERNLQNESFCQQYWPNHKRSKELKQNDVFVQFNDSHATYMHKPALFCRSYFRTHLSTIENLEKFYASQPGSFFTTREKSELAEKFFAFLESNGEFLVKNGQISLAGDCQESSQIDDHQRELNKEKNNLFFVLRLNQNCWVKYWTSSESSYSHKQILFRFFLQTFATK